MLKILVTGSNGLLGQTLTNLITSTKRAELIASSKGKDRYTGSGNYHYAELDIADKSQLLDVVSMHNPDVIINTAAVTNVDTCHIERDTCHLLNTEAVKYLVEICEARSVQLIHLSTDFVFDGQSGPYSEEDKPNPLNYYGESKAEAERVIQDSTCSWAILRTILVYGVTANMSRSNIVLWAKSALQKGEIIKAVNDQWRMPTLALDLAEACLLVAEKKATGIFHISGKDMMTVHELVMQVADFWNFDKSLIQPISSQTLNQDAKRPLKTGFVLDKAIHMLGYKPHSFLEGLEIVNQQLKDL